MRDFEITNLWRPKITVADPVSVNSRDNKEDQGLKIIIIIKTKTKKTKNFDFDYIGLNFV